jgi:hypothetical protein
MVRGAAESKAKNFGVKKLISSLGGVLNDPWFPSELNLARAFDY